MIVNCFLSQENLFETRILKRLAEINFLSFDDFIEEQAHPLILFGNWFEDDYSKFNLLLSYAFDLKFPCILFPPFNVENWDKILNLNVSFETKPVDTNYIHVQDPELLDLLSKEVLKIQTDYCFVGAAGKTLVSEIENNQSVISSLQNKNTDTPLIICGIRLFSTSGLSDDEDRKKLLKVLIQWTSKRYKYIEVKEKTILKDDNYFLNNSGFKNICVLLVVLENTTLSKLDEMTKSIFGLNIENTELNDSIEFLITRRLLEKVENKLIVKEQLVELVQDLGLWSYVRILKKNINV